MKNLLEGAASIKEALEKGPRGDSKFLKLADGESATIRFMQELDKSGKNYDEKKGLAIGFYEHLNPKDYSQSFRCTMDSEGRCAGCERVPTDKKWRARGRLLVNVLVRKKDGPNEVKILGTSITSKGLTPYLVEFADDYGSLCDRDYKMTRRGEGINTSYSLLPRDVAPIAKADNDLEIIDLSTVVRDLSYDEQETLLSGSGKDDW